MQKRNILLMGLVICMLIGLTACFKGEQSSEEIDAPQNSEAVNRSEANLDIENEEQPENEESSDLSAEETVGRQLYLLDANNMLAPQTVELPQLESKEVATQVLEHLVKGGPITPILPNGFQAVLPEGTEVLGLDLQEDGTLVVDLSPEFENYEAAEEVNIIQSMTYTLTQFDNVDRIQLRINGYEQDEMPVNGTPIMEGYSRANGINLVDTDIVDLMESKAVTMYYPTEYNDNRYYVPVTQHIPLDKENEYASIVQALMEGPGYQVNVSNVFNSDTLLVNPPKLQNGILELEFNQEILKDMDESIIADEVVETLVRTLTEQKHVDSVEVKVEELDELVNENGEAYDEPVTANALNSMKKF